MWDHYVSRSAAERIDIVAHSYGGCVTVTLVREPCVIVTSGRRTVCHCEIGKRTICHCDIGDSDSHLMGQPSKEIKLRSLQ